MLVLVKELLDCVLVIVLENKVIFELKRKMVFLVDCDFVYLKVLYCLLISWLS